MASREQLPPGRVEIAASGAIFLLALAPRLLHIREIEAAGLGDFLRLDPLYYDEWARRIAGGDWLGHDVFEMSPLYPYALGLLYKLLGTSLTAPRVLQAILGALSCAGTFLLGARLFGRAAGAVAGVALAVYGPAIFYDAQINKTTLALALTLGFSGAMAISRARRAGWIAAGGVLLGLTALVHENVNVAGPVLVAWLLLPPDPAPWGDRLRRAGLFVACYAAAVLPATVHNVAAAGEYVLITSAGGENFYTGNNEAAGGRYSPPPFVRPDPFFEHEDFRAEAARRLGRPVTRREASAFWWREGLSFIAAHPGRYVRLLGDKLLVYLNDFERPDNFSYDNFKLFSPTLALPWLTFGALVPFTVVGIAASASRFRELVPIYAGFGAYLLSAIIFFTQSRYRMPSVALWALFAGYGAVWTARAARAGDWRRLAAASGTLLCAGLVTFADPGNGPAFHAQNDAILGELNLHAGRPKQAAAYFESGIEKMAPAAEAGDAEMARITGAARLGLGLARAQEGDASGAEAAFRQAARCPDIDVRVDALLALADLLSRGGGGRDLAAILGEASALRPGDFALKVRHAQALYKEGRTAEARGVIEAALASGTASDPLDEADAWYGLAMILAPGDPIRAAGAYRRVLELSPGHPRAAWMREQVRKLEGSAP